MDNSLWEWNYKEKRYWHKSCEAYAEEYHCPICLRGTPDSFTWGDLMVFIRREGFHKDEYFSYSENLVQPQAQVFADDINGDHCHAVACFWVVGGSEGYYVHIQPVYGYGEYKYGRLKEGLIGKFWNQKRAEKAVKAIQAFINEKT
jgi:hypothetical protein